MSDTTELIRDWIEENISSGMALEGVEVVVTAETADLEPPFIAVYETSADPHESNSVVMYGVTDYEITVELQTVPLDASEGGTGTSDEKSMRSALYDIIANRAAIDWINDREGWRVFDIRLPSPLTESDNDRRVSRSPMEVTACPI